MAGDWLADQRSQVAAERILDAAGQLFTRREAASVGMHEIAGAAGCSRATVYRYFENREALYTAFVHRESRRLYREVGEQVADVADPRDRLIEAILSTLRCVRNNPALSSWFATTDRPIGAEMADRSEVIKALAQTFLTSLVTDDGERLELRARWLVRVITSLLVFPGRDEADERAMLEEFVVPAVAAQATR